MKLAELIDIECQILKDDDIDPGELRKRDRKIGLELENLGKDKNKLLLAWLKRVRTGDLYSPGLLFETGFRWFGFFLVFFGLLMGGTTAATVLAYDGSSPVNLIHFLAIFVGVQLLTILFFLTNLLPAFLKKILPGNGNFYNFIRELNYLFSRLTGKIFSHLPKNKFSKLFSDLQQLKIRQKLYSTVEKWLVISLTQRFSLAFNFGALITCLYLITFSDLAFAWNTTLQISSAAFHRIVSLIAFPWSALYPDGLPSMDLVETSRYFRLNGEYIVTPANPDLSQAAAVGGWWLFLILALTFYGLLPRIILFSFAKIKLNIVLSKLPMNSADFESLFDRLTRPLLETGAIKPDKTITDDSFSNGFKPNFKITSKNCTAIKWGDLEIPDAECTKLIRDRFNWNIKNKLEAGSLDYNSSDVAALNFVEGQKKNDPILIIAEAWEAPTSILYFLKKLRQVTSLDRQIIVGLVYADSKQNRKSPLLDDFRSWKRELATLADPYLRVESMVEES